MISFLTNFTKSAIYFSTNSIMHYILGWREYVYNKITETDVITNYYQSCSYCCISWNERDSSFILPSRQKHMGFWSWSSTGAMCSLSIVISLSKHMYENSRIYIYMISTFLKVNRYVVTGVRREQVKFWKPERYAVATHCVRPVWELRRWAVACVFVITYVIDSG